jgi:Tol biopolymer transport system component
MNLHRLRLPYGSAVTALSVVALSLPAAAQNPVSRVSVDGAGAQGNGDSGILSHGSISQDGRWVAFESQASNLVSGDTNGVADIFVKDLATGAIVRITEDSTGRQGNGSSSSPCLSKDGRFVAFESLASNLVAGDTNGSYDVFRCDRDPDANGIFDEGNSVTIRVSVRTNGTQGNADSVTPSISGDGLFVAFASAATNLVVGDTNGFTDIFVRDVAASKTTQMSVDASLTPLSNGHSHAPSISSDGSLVAYSSYASNLVSGDVNGYEDVFVFDRVNKIATLVSVSSALTQGDNDSSGAAISADGKFVAFASYATNLVASDTNSVSDIFEHEIATALTTRMSVDSAGAEGDFDSYSPAINSDGTVVAFESLSDNLSPNDTNGLTDVFAHDVGTAATDCMTLNAVGVPSDGFGSYRPELSGDGVLVAFTSSADNLVTGDSNGVFDIFLRDRSLPPRSASWAQYGNGFPGTLFTPDLTASANPVFGASLTLDADNSSGGPTFGLLFVGAGSTSLQTNKGGQILVAWNFILAIPFAGAGGVSLPVTIPLDLSLVGADAFLQMIEADSGAPFGFSFTPGLQLTFGI